MIINHPLTIQVKYCKYFKYLNKFFQVESPIKPRTEDKTKPRTEGETEDKTKPRTEGETEDKTQLGIVDNKTGL